MSGELDELPPEVAALMRRERERDDAPSTEFRSRLRSRVAASLGVGVTAWASTNAAASTGKATAAGGKLAIFAGGGAKIALVVVAVGAVATAGYVVGRHRSTVRPAAVAATRAAVPAASTLAPARVAASPSVAIPPPAAPHPAASRSAASQRRLLAEEHALLEKARAALADDDAATALTALDRHARRFPDGQLAEERDVLRVRALAAHGDGDAARGRAAEFERRYPSSLFLPMVRGAVNETANPPNP